MSVRWTIAAAVAAAAASPAVACTPPPPPPAAWTQEQTDEGVRLRVRQQFDAALDLVDLRMVRTATTERDGAAVVTRSLKGRVPRGTRLRIHTMDTVSCGYGDAPRGRDYRMYVSDVPTAFFQPLEPDTKRILAQIGVLPPDWR